MEFVIGGVAALGAGVFTNPLEVAKTRMQLQGELAKKGQYRIHYKNVFHAFYTIGTVDGLLSLQKGLVPALWYQLFANGIRLGVYQSISDRGLTKNLDNTISLPRSVLAGATAGCVGAFVGSPFYMIKVQLQSMAKQEIAVGHQHRHSGMYEAFVTIYRQHGIMGLWRGVGSIVPRVMVGSGTQLTTFAWSKERITSRHIFPENSIMTTLVPSFVSGCAIVVVQQPFDVVVTRVYNQGTDASGKGLLYRNTVDCFLRIYREEGILAFYKGWGATIFRLGPHSFLTLVFWSQLNLAYQNMHL